MGWACKKIIKIIMKIIIDKLRNLCYIKDIQSEMLWVIKYYLSNDNGPESGWVGWKVYCKGVWGCFQRQVVYRRVLSETTIC